MSAIEEKIGVIEALIVVFADLIKNKDQVFEIDEFLSANHRIPRGTINEILVNTDKLNFFSEEEICVLTGAIYNSTKNEMLNPIQYFSQRILKKAAKYKYKNENELISLPVSYEKVLSGSENDFVTKLHYKTIRDSWNSEIWTYNYETQRNPIKRAKKNGEYSLKPKLNQKSVEEIKSLMLEGKYKPDTIVINVLMDGSDEIFYNEDAMELIIESADQINLIDGFHRVQAVIAALEENPELDGYLYVSIRNYDLETARFYLGQHNSFNTFDKTHIRQLKSLNISDKIVEDLNSKSDLKKKITTSTAVKRKMGELTNFAVLSDTIKVLFEPSTGKDRLDISHALIRFFDYLLGSYPEAFVTDAERVFKKSWINHHNTFVGYLVVAHALFKKHGKDFPLDEVARIVGSINFSKEQSEFNDLMTTQGKVNSNQVKAKIRKFFEDKVSELV